jgi:REP-associated tyrosine transposase
MREIMHAVAEGDDLGGLCNVADLSCAFSAAPKARPSIAAWGSAPGLWHTKASALKARFTSRAIFIIIRSVPQSLAKVIVHIVFSTKDRQPWFDPQVRPRIHAYLATICRDLGADLVHVGGAADHVHVVTTLPRTVSQAELVEKIKKSSSKWMKTLGARYQTFFWQRGYGAFSVGRRELEAVIKYVHAQDEHHRTRTFQEEYRELLRRNGVDFDERYVWD